MKLGISLLTRALMIGAAFLFLQSQDPLSRGLPMLALFCLGLLALFTSRNVAEGPLFARILAGLDVIAVGAMPLLIWFGDDPWTEEVAISLAFIALPVHAFAALLSRRISTRTV